MHAGRRNTDPKAVGLLVQLKHPDVGTFVDEYAPHLTPGGMFIRARQPQPVGTRVRFEVQIAGGVRVLKGVGHVEWTRAANDPAGPPGMGVQFEELDAPSQALVERMRQGRASGLTPRPATASTPPPPRPSAAPPSGAGLDDLFADVPLDPTPSQPPDDAFDLDFSDVAPSAPPPARTPPPSATRTPPPARPLAPPDDAFDLDFSGLEAEPAPITPAPRAPTTPAPRAPTTPAPAALDDELDFSSLSLEPEPAPARTPTPRPSTPPAPPPRPSLASTPPPPAVRPARASTPPPPPARAAVAPPPPPPPEDEEDLPLALDVEPLEDADAPLTAASSEMPDWLEHTGASFTPAPAAPAPAARRTEPLELTLDASADEAPDWLERSTSAPAARKPAATPPPSAAAPGALPTIRREAPQKASAAPAVPTVLTPAAQQPSRPPPPARPAALGGEAPLVFLSAPGPTTDTGPVIGIDLGTTNSCVALLGTGARPQVLRSKDGYNTIPSVVSLTPQGKLLVSHRAKSQLLLNPGGTISGAKRLVGRGFDSAVVQEVKSRFHYEIVPDAAGRAAVRLGEHVLSLEEVQGLILRECKEMAEQHLGQPVGRAVVTVPAYYSEPQREAVRKAGALAGLKVERILNEPTAAALAYGLNRGLEKRVLVYDLGGGTFDATVLKVSQNTFEVLATGGDVFLGGIDFDNLLVDHLLKRFEAQERVPFKGDSVALSRVADAAERAKMALSERASVEVDIPMLMVDDAGTPRSLRLTLTRQELNDVCGPLVARTLDVVRDVLLDAKLKPQDVDDIILVGGQSRMPLAREQLKEFFGKGPLASVNADEAVALGAALYSSAGGEKAGAVKLVDVLPMTIGVGLPGGGFKRVVERNTPLPAQRSFALSTQKDNEAALELSVFQGEDAHVAGNEYLGTVRLEDLPRGPKGAVKVAVTLKLDAECVLHVEARELTTRRTVKATLATRYSSEELQAQLRYSAQEVRAAEERKGEELRSRGGSFWGRLKRAFGRAR